jgi:hypothetical protein
VESDHVEVFVVSQEFDLHVTFTVVMDVYSALRNGSRSLSLFGNGAKVEHLRLDDFTVHFSKVEGPGEDCLLVNKFQKHLGLCCFIELALHHLDTSQSVDLISDSFDVASHVSNDSLL